jgi:hypothetical protein
MRIATSTILAVAVVAGAALAQQPRPTNVPPPPGSTINGRSVAPVGVLIAGFDADGDARTTRDEHRAGTTRSFALADANKDGKLGLIELSNWAAVWLGDVSALPGRFDFDRDFDDAVSPAEFAAELDRRFTRYDADKDNVVVRGELLQAQPLRPDRDEKRPRLPEPPQRQ